MHNRRVDIGKDYDWTECTFKEPRNLTEDGKRYLTKLQKTFYDNTHKSKDEARQNKDGNPCSIKDQIFALSSEQRVIVWAAVDAIVKFLRNDPDYKPFHATVLGCAGTGKSFVISAIMDIVQNYTKCIDSVKVTAHSGGAAYNVKGCTLHRLLSIGINSPWNPVSKKKQEAMKLNLKTTLALIVDERSMIESKTIAAAERNMRQCAFGGQNTSEVWGGLPVVIVFGDDYQLPPIQKKGAIQGFAQKKKTGIMKETKKTQK